MTVGELIAELKKYDPNLPVYQEDTEWGIFRAYGVEGANIRSTGNIGLFSNPFKYTKSKKVNGVMIK